MRRKTALLPAPAAKSRDLMRAPEVKVDILKMMILLVW